MIIYRRVLCLSMFHKILVAVDGSDASLHALEVAAKISIDNDAELTILTVAPYPPPMFTEDAMPTYLPQYQTDLRESHKKMLAKINKEIKTKNPKLRTVPIVMEGKPAQTIIDAAKARESDLIIVGNRGQGGDTLRRFHILGGNMPTSRDERRQQGLPRQGIHQARHATAVVGDEVDGC